MNIWCPQIGKITGCTFGFVHPLISYVCLILSMYIHPGAWIVGFGLILSERWFSRIHVLALSTNTAFCTFECICSQVFVTFWLLMKTKLMRIDQIIMGLHICLVTVLHESLLFHVCRYSKRGEILMIYRYIWKQSCHFLCILVHCLSNVLFLHKAQLHEANERFQVAQKEKEELKESLQMSNVSFKAMWIGLESLTACYTTCFTCKQSRLGPF